MNQTLFEIYNVLILKIFPFPELLYGFLMAAAGLVMLRLVMMPVLRWLEKRHDAWNAVRMLHGSIAVIAGELILWPPVFYLILRGTGFGWSTGNIRYRMVVMALFLIWILGFLMKAGMFGRLVIARRKEVQSSVPAGEVPKELLVDLKKNLGIRQTVLIRQSAAIYSPEIRGVLYPVIMIPEGYENHISGTNLRIVLTHELMHHRHGDVWFRSLLCLIDMMLWFIFPYAWWNRQLRIWEERYCDECTCTAEMIRPQDYVDTLLDEQVRRNVNRKRRTDLAAFFYLDDFRNRLDWLEEKPGLKPLRWLFLLLLVLLTAVSGLTAAAAGVGLERITWFLGQSPVEGYDVRLDDWKTAVTPSGDLLMETDPSASLPADMKDFELAEDLGILPELLKPGEEWRSGAFHAYRSQQIILTGMALPVSTAIQAGIIGQNGLRTYAVVNGSFNMVIPVHDSGYQRVFLRNLSRDTVTVGGGYCTVDAAGEEEHAAEGNMPEEPESQESEKDILPDVIWTEMDEPFLKLSLTDPVFENITEGECFIQDYAVTPFGIWVLIGGHDIVLYQNQKVYCRLDLNELAGGREVHADLLAADGDTLILAEGIDNRTLNIMTVRHVFRKSPLVVQTPLDNPEDRAYLGEYSDYYESLGQLAMLSLKDDHVWLARSYDPYVTIAMVLNEEGAVTEVSTTQEKTMVNGVEVSLMAVLMENNQGAPVKMMNNTLGSNIRIRCCGGRMYEAVAEENISCVEIRLLERTIHGNVKSSEEGGWPSGGEPLFDFPSIGDMDMSVVCTRAEAEAAAARDPMVIVWDVYGENDTEIIPEDLRQTVETYFGCWKHGANWSSYDFVAEDITERWCREYAAWEFEKADGYVGYSPFTFGIVYHTPACLRKIIGLTEDRAVLDITALGFEHWLVLEKEADGWHITLDAGKKRLHELYSEEDSLAMLDVMVDFGIDIVDQRGATDELYRMDSEEVRKAIEKEGYSSGEYLVEFCRVTSEKELKMLMGENAPESAENVLIAQGKVVADLPTGVNFYNCCWVVRQGEDGTWKVLFWNMARPE